MSDIEIGKIYKQNKSMSFQKKKKTVLKTTIFISRVTIWIDYLQQQNNN